MAQMTGEVTVRVTAEAVLLETTPSASTPTTVNE
jgi:hypothetical protein